MGLFITAGLAISPGAAAAQTLDISIESETGGSPPGELLTDPAGDRTGPMTKDIHLSDPMSGFYNLRVIGRKPGLISCSSRLIPPAAAPRMCGSPI